MLAPFQFRTAVNKYLRMNAFHFHNNFFARIGTELQFFKSSKSTRTQIYFRVLFIFKFVSKALKQIKTVSVDSNSLITLKTVEDL